MKTFFYIAYFGLILIGLYKGIAQQEYAHATFDLSFAILLRLSYKKEFEG